MVIVGPHLITVMGFLPEIWNSSSDTWIFSGERTAGRSVLMAVGEDLQLSEWLSTFITKQEYLKIQSI
jgi:hypothetical protein